MPSATIAHEGNPRTNSLTISGTLDGDIFLIPVPTIPVPPTPLPPVPPADVGWQVFASNAAKYTISADFAYGVDGDTGEGLTQMSNSILVSPETFIPTAGQILEYSEKSGTSMYGMVRSPKIRTNRRYYDSQLSVVEPIFQNFPAIDFQDVTVIDYNRYKKPTSPFAPWQRLEFYSTCRISVIGIGAPFSGAAVGVRPDSTHDDFTGIVSAYNWGDGFQYLMRYEHRPLNSPSVILARTARAAPAVDASVQLRIRIELSDFSVSFIDSASTVSGLTTGDIPYFGADMRVAVVNLPPTVNSGIDDVVVWKQIGGTIFGQ